MGNVMSAFLDDDDFSPGAARNSDPETSHEAAESVNASALEQLVMDEIYKSEDGLTADELVQRTGLSQNTITPRTAPLRRKGLLYTDGTTRIALSGRRVLVWKPVNRRKEERLL